MEGFKKNKTQKLIKSNVNYIYNILFTINAVYMYKTQPNYGSHLHTARADTLSKEFRKVLEHSCR